MYKLYDCSVNNFFKKHYPKHPLNRETELFKDLKIEANKYGFQFIADYRKCDILITNTCFDPDALDYAYKHKLKKINNKDWSKRLQILTENRENYIDNYFNQFVSKTINYCLKNKIGNIIIGYNEGWKNECNIGKINNQKFMNIPHLKFKIKLENKCKKYGITFTFIEESYTSKCSFIDKELIEKHTIYGGKRIQRGLFKSSNGQVLNADINGAANIMRKVIGDAVYSQPILGLMFNPVKLEIF